MSGPRCGICQELPSSFQESLGVIGSLVLLVNSNSSWVICLEVRHECNKNFLVTNIRPWSRQRCLATIVLCLWIGPCTIWSVLGSSPTSPTALIAASAAPTTIVGIGTFSSASPTSRATTTISSASSTPTPPSTSTTTSCSLLGRHCLERRLLLAQLPNLAKIDVFAQ